MQLRTDKQNIALVIHHIVHKIIRCNCALKVYMRSLNRATAHFNPTHPVTCKRPSSCANKRFNGSLGPIRKRLLCTALAVQSLGVLFNSSSAYLTT